MDNKNETCFFTFNKGAEYWKHTGKKLPSEKKLIKHLLKEVNPETHQNKLQNEWDKQTKAHNKAQKAYETIRWQEKHAMKLGKVSNIGLTREVETETKFINLLTSITNYTKTMANLPPPTWCGKGMSHVIVRLVTDRFEKKYLEIKIAPTFLWAEYKNHKFKKQKFTFSKSEFKKLYRNYVKGKGNRELKYNFYWNSRKDIGHAATTWTLSGNGLITGLEILGNQSNAELLKTYE